MAVYIPYCGSPPSPDTLVWNTDPLLIGALLGIAGLYAWGCRGLLSLTMWNRIAFATGWTIVAAALVSPLCNLSITLFSARVAQHMILTVLAAPLIVIGRPHEVFANAFGRKAQKAPSSPGWECVVATLAFTLALWIWHLPAPYDYTLRSNAIYWLMHVSLFGCSLFLWRTLLHEGLNYSGFALIAGVATTIQMNLLGAVLTLAPRTLFTAHLGTTASWGLTTLEDQQLGGLLMWVPGGIVFTASTITAFGLWLSQVSRGDLAEAPTSTRM